MDKIDKGENQLKLESESNFPSFSEEEEQKIRDLKAGFLTNLRRYATLRECEKVKEDFFSYLKEDFDEFKKNTTVFFRSTNLAEYYVVFRDFIMEGEAIQRVERQQEDRPIILESVESKLTELFVKTLAKAIGGKVADAAIKEIFGDSGVSKKEIKDLFDDLKIFIEQQKIIDIGNFITTKLYWLGHDYATIKATAPNKQYTASSIFKDLKDIQEKMQEYLFAIKSDPRFTSDTDKDNYDRRWLFRTYASIGLSRLLFLIEQAYWGEYMLHHSSDSDGFNRTTRNIMLNFIENFKQDIKTQTQEISNIRLGFITGVYRPSIEFNQWCYYDNYFYTVASGENHTGDPLRNTLGDNSKFHRDQENWNCPDQKQHAYDVLNGRREKYVGDMKKALGQCIENPMQNALESVLVVPMFFMDAACYNSLDKEYWFFANNQCFRRKFGGSIESGQATATVFPGLPKLGETSTKYELSGAAYVKRDNKYIFTINDKYYILDGTSKRVQDSGKLSDKWKGLDVSRVDCLVYAEHLNKLYFFKGGKYWSGSPQGGAVTESTVEEGWGPGMPKYINSAVYNFTSSMYYFFHGIQYTPRPQGNNPQKPEQIRGNW
ncbi:MAG: hypothetical protein F6J96_02145 [Symploca sp. SIO1C2]|nr:hypothetical protein [Symploca sp. SIO1C2]